jgi:2-polyprenyl-3-methyl-5-hydroxy-6-metoxy-1,4-benzoquinol methylase
MRKRGSPSYPLGLRVLGDIVPTREGNDRWSEVYDGDGNPLIALEGPQVERMLGDVHGLRIADVAAGTSRHFVRFANVGATVTALDFSRGMLTKARTKPGADRVSFVIADCRSAAAVARWHFRTRRVRAARRPRSFSRFAHERVGAHLLS